MTRTHRTNRAGQISRMRVLAALVPVALLFAASGDASDLEPLTKGGWAGKIVSYSAKTMPSTTKELVTVPAGKNFMLTTVCVEHGAMTVDAGSADQPLAFSTPGCTSFRPGFRVAAGNTVRCVNSSGSSHSCSVVGVMGDDLSNRSRRAVFIDVDAAVKAAEAASQANRLD